MATSPQQCFFVGMMRTLKMYSLNNFQVYIILYMINNGSLELVPLRKTFMTLTTPKGPPPASGVVFLSIL